MRGALWRIKALSLNLFKRLVYPLKWEFYQGMVKNSYEDGCHWIFSCHGVKKAHEKVEMCVEKRGDSLLITRFTDPVLF
jgi:hypothetical protein